MRELNKFLRSIEEVRAIAQTGLHFAEGHFDQERYRRLIEITGDAYGEILEIPTGEILEQFRKDLGCITPKVSADAAIFSADGKILLVQRTDNNRWCLPGGWCEVSDTPERAVEREVFEETGLIASCGEIIRIFTEFPGEYGRLHTSYHLLFSCVHVAGEFKESYETKNIGFYDPRVKFDFNDFQAAMIQAACTHRMAAGLPVWEEVQNA